MNTSEIITLLRAHNPTVRHITAIVIHCSATKEGKDFGAEDIDRWHRERGFNGIGYHFVVRLDGTIEVGRLLSLAGAHTTGHNQNTIGICYIGGLDEDGKAKDTRTDEQKKALRWLITAIKTHMPYGLGLRVKGHRDYSHDRNGNGVIDKYERIKECPCFDAIPEYDNY